jgi:putative phage-type endonuclease
VILTPVQVDLESNSDEWLSWRSAGVGSSDIPIILGIDPWKDIHTLWLEKLGLQEKPPTTWYMQRGHDEEPTARFLFEWEMGRQFPAACFTTLEHPWAKASLDGWNRPDIWENKRPGKTNHRKYLKSGPPDHYVVQMLWQLGIAKGLTNHFSSFNADFPEDQQFVVYKVPYDEARFLSIFEKAHAFYRCLERAIPPAEGMLEQSVTGIYAPTF